MIDLHCHTLPAIDHDGPRRLKEVLNMARIAVADGIRQVVATPHVAGALPEPESVREGVDCLNWVLQQERIDLEVLPGAENCATLNVEYLKQHTINGTDYVLLEFPHSHLPQNAPEVVFNCLSAGLRPILAHLERNPTVKRRPDQVLELAAAGALIQMTAESLTGGFGPDTRACARYLLKRQVVHFLASDSHSSDGRKPQLSAGYRAASRIVGETAARRLVADNPALVVSGQSINE